MLISETNIQTCENGHFDDRQKAEHNKKLKYLLWSYYKFRIFATEITQSNTQKLDLACQKPNVFQCVLATYRRTDEFQKTTVAE